MEDSPVFTPSVDRFRRTAMHFAEAYTPSPHCCPSRATFFSGLMPSQHGVWHNVENNNAISRDLYEGVKLFPEDLKENGYHTFFSGKWHVSAFAGSEEHGFDEILRYFTSNYGQMERGYRIHSEDWDNFYSDSAAIDREGDEKEFGQIIRPGYPKYFQFGVDENPFGDRDSVDRAVEALGNYHGDLAGAHGMWSKGIPCYRESYNICAMIGGPGVHPGIEKNHFVSLADFAPTILELAGISEEREFAGCSLVPFLEGQIPEHWRAETYTQTNGNEMYGIQRAVFDHKWKYVFNGFDYDILYDLENDPQEMHNIIDKENSGKIVKEMCRKMWRFGKQVTDNCTCPYIMTSFAPYGPGIIFEDAEEERNDSRQKNSGEKNGKKSI